MRPSVAALSALLSSLPLFDLQVAESGPTHRAVPVSYTCRRLLTKSTDRPRPQAERERPTFGIAVCHVQGREAAVETTTITPNIRAYHLRNSGLRDIPYPRCSDKIPLFQFLHKKSSVASPITLKDPIAILFRQRRAHRSPLMRAQRREILESPGTVMGQRPQLSSQFVRRMTLPRK